MPSVHKTRKGTVHTSRKYACQYCSKSYGKAEHLIRHERSHTGEKPFRCPRCKRGFSRLDSLNRHQQQQGHDGVPAISASELYESEEAFPNSTDAIAADENLNEAFNLPTSNSILFTQTSTTLLDHSAAHADSTQLHDQEVDFTLDANVDPLLQLTWPDSEAFLQTILSSSLGPWEQNFETLPSQYLISNHEPLRTEQDSPWLPQNADPSSGTGTQAIRNVSQIISELSANITSDVESAALSITFLEACLHVFFAQVVPIFPVCHRPTFVFRDWTHPLLLNSIALGSLFLSQEINVAKGEVLWTLAHTAVATSWHSLITHKGQHDSCPGVQLILTAVLGQTYAMLSKSAKLRSTAQIFHSLGFYWARKCDLYTASRTLNVTDLLTTNNIERKNEAWKFWVAEEVQLRALLGHYILDGQLTYFTGAPTCQRHASNPLRLPCQESLFNATSLDEWLACLETETSSSVTFQQVLLDLYEDPAKVLNLKPRLSLLTVQVLLEGVQSFVTEANQVEGSVLGRPPDSATRSALASIHKYITLSDHFSEGEKAELLLRWHTVCIDIDVNFNSLCRKLCLQFGVEQTVFTTRKSSEPLMDLKKWARSSPARRGLLHAVAVCSVSGQLSMERAHAVHVPLSIFVCTTVYCAFLLAGISSIHVPLTPQWSSVLSKTVNDLSTTDNETEVQLYNYLMSSSNTKGMASKNLLYDANIFLLRLRQLLRPWGICAEFESIVQQWLSKCGI